MSRKRFKPEEIVNKFVRPTSCCPRAKRSPRRASRSVLPSKPTTAGGGSTAEWRQTSPWA